jgi:hypothetical protein
LEFQCESLQSSNIRVDTDTTDSFMISILHNIQHQIFEINETLSLHIKETNLQMSSIKDEIVSIKRHVSLVNSQTKDSFDSLLLNSKNVEKDVKILTESMQRKLQSFFDCLKTVQRKDINPKSSDRYTVERDNIFTTDDTQIKRPISEKSTSSKRTKTLIIGDSCKSDRIIYRFHRCFTPPCKTSRVF